MTLAKAVKFPEPSIRRTFVPLYANVRFAPAGVTVQLCVPPVIVTVPSSVGFEEGALVLSCVCTLDVTPST